MIGAATEGVLESREIVYVHRDHAVGAHGLEYLRHVARRDRIARLGLRVFPGISQVRDYGRYARGRSVFECADEKQQADQLVVYALFGGRIERLDDENILMADISERAGFVFAVFEIPFLA